MNQLVHPPATPSGPWSLPLAPAQERFNDRNPEGRRLRSQAHACELSVTDRSRPPTPFTGPSYRRLRALP
jgi:hypothetical protein